eukprot:2113837-Prymnesium_polylepis.1
MVYFVTRPDSSNVSEHACGGLTRLLPVGTGANGGNGPVFVPLPRAVYQTRLPSYGSTLKA